MAEKNYQWIDCLFIRHGKTNGNLERRYIGQRTDEPLSEEGRRDALKLKAMLCQYGDRILFSSPMKRAVETAELLYPGVDIHIIDDLKETDFGLFEGKNFEELKENADYQEWMRSGGTMAFPEGEDRDSVTRRVLRAFREALRVGKNMAFICHGGTIMSILSELTGEDYYSFQVSNLDGFVVRFKVIGDEIDEVSYHRICSGVSS